MENRLAASATSAVWVSLPKSTILDMVDATLALMCVIIRTPRKLNTAAITIAFLVDRQRVVMQVAIALGASVQPLTKITHRVRNAEMSIIGLLTTWDMKYEKDTSTYVPCLQILYPDFT